MLYPNPNTPDSKIQFKKRYENYINREWSASASWTRLDKLLSLIAAFGGYKKSGIGRENHKMMLEHYQQTKNLLVSYSPDPLGFF